MLHKMLIHFKIYWTRILYQDAPDTPDVSCTHLNKGRVHNVSVSCHLDLFDKIIIPTRYVNLWIRDMGLRKY